MRIPPHHLLVYIIITLIVVVLGLVYLVVSLNGIVTLIPADQRPTAPSASETTNGTSTSSSSQLLTYVDADGRFSLDYPSSLILEVSRDIDLKIDSASFKNGTASAFTVNVRRANARWPDLEAYLNDQILASKGGGDSPEKMITLPSGIEFIDVGNRPLLGHMFFAQLSPTEFIEFSFYDEVYVESVLSSIVFSKPAVITDSASNIPEGWNVLKSAEHGFEIGYPSDYVVAKNESVGVILPNAWKISQLGDLPKGHHPRTVYVEVIDPKTIHANRLDGTYVKYDAEQGVCYIDSILDNTREYTDGVINGFVACRYSVGDAGSFGSAVFIIYPDKMRALKVSTGADEYQEMAPLDDFAKTVQIIKE